MLSVLKGCLILWLPHVCPRKNIGLKVPVCTIVASYRGPSDHGYPVDNPTSDVLGGAGVYTNLEVLSDPFNLFTLGVNTLKKDTFINH